MKKIYIFFIIIVFSIFMVSCEGSYSKENELKRFFNSHSVDIYCKIRIPNKPAASFTIVATENAFLMESSTVLGNDEELSIIVDKDNNLFYNLGESIAHVKLEPEEDAEIEPEEDDEIIEEVDPFDYISNIYKSETMMTFDFNMVEYMELIDSSFSNMIPSDEVVTGSCYFDEQKIKQLEYKIGEVKVIIKVNNYVYYDYVSSEDVGIKIDIPNIDECVSMSEAELSEHISTGASGDVDNYELVIKDYNIAEINGEIIKDSFRGYIYDKTNDVIVKGLNIDDVYFDMQNYLEQGDNNIKACIDYVGKQLAAEIILDVKKDIVIEEITTLDEIGKLKYIFELDDYLYVCDEKYLYKYDLECQEVLGKLDLQCIGIDHFVRDDYLYVAAHYPYTTTYNPSNSYKGTVTQIRLSDFTIEKQVHVNCLPRSIIVDNRGSVILSKGANQHVYVSEVNMETGMLTSLFSSYQNDVLLYDPLDDEITVVTLDHTGDNDLYKYNGVAWERKGYSQLEIDDYCLKVDDSYVTSNGVYYKHSVTNEYVFEEFEYAEDNELKYGNDILFATVGDGKAYIAESKRFDDVVRNLIVYDLETKTYVRYMISEEDRKLILFMYENSGYVFMIHEDGSIYKVKI